MYNQGRDSLAFNDTTEQQQRALQFAFNVVLVYVVVVGQRVLSQGKATEEEEDGSLNLCEQRNNNNNNRESIRLLCLCLCLVSLCLDTKSLGQCRRRGGDERRDGQDSECVANLNY